MTEQIERADLARVYRAIGNSKAPMPESINAYPASGSVALYFEGGNEAAVRIWADATGGTVGREPVRNGQHVFGTAVADGEPGEWMGWRISAYTHVKGEHPVSEAILGTGDEPADEAIVPSDDQADEAADDREAARTGGTFASRYLVPAFGEAIVPDRSAS